MSQQTADRALSTYPARSLFCSLPPSSVSCIVVSDVDFGVPWAYFKKDLTPTAHATAATHQRSSSLPSCYSSRHLQSTSKTFCQTHNEGRNAHLSAVTIIILRSGHEHQEETLSTSTNATSYKCKNGQAITAIHPANLHFTGDNIQFRTNTIITIAKCEITHRQRQLTYYQSITSTPLINNIPPLPIHRRSRLL